MKKIIFSLIIGIVLSSGIVYAASLYKAKDISYNKENWEVTNVNDALDDLYEIQKNFANELVKAGDVDTDGNMCLSTKYVERADYLRLSQVGLKYNIPIRSKVIKGMSVRLSGHNLLTLTPYSGWNPDVNCFGASALTGGIDYGSYPIMRTYILGFNIKF